MSIDVAAEGTTLSTRVAEEIRAAMARRRISGAEVARRLDVSPMWVSYRLAGRQEIGLTDLERIAGVLGMSPVDLLPSDVRRSGQPTEARVAQAVRPPDRRPKDKPGSDRAGHRTQRKRTLTPEERSLIAV
jgi:transcriptional regulator with XRE-family HTH domain